MYARNLIVLAILLYHLEPELRSPESPELSAETGGQPLVTIGGGGGDLPIGYLPIGVLPIGVLPIGYFPIGALPMAGCGGGG